MVTKIKFLFLLISVSLFFTQCTTDETSRQATIQITDAPIDDADVSAVFITVAQVKVDGNIFSGFSGKQTINIKALQNGAVKALGTANLDAKAYSNVTLVLDLDTDAAGNAMGCYVQRANGTKESLAAGATGTIEITSQGVVDLLATSNSAVDIVLDFDLRKAIKSSGSSSYSFVSSSELNASVRSVLRPKTGSINGICSNGLSSSSYDKIVAYVYAEGSYNSTEKNAQGTSGIQFKNAVTSSVVDSNGNFNASFLKEGKYEVVFAAYEYDNQNKASFKGVVEVGGVLSGSVLGLVTVQAQASVNLNLTFSAIL